MVLGIVRIDEKLNLGIQIEYALDVLVVSRIGLHIESLLVLDQKVLDHIKVLLCSFFEVNQHFHKNKVLIVSDQV